MQYNFCTSTFPAITHVHSWLFIPRKFVHSCKLQKVLILYWYLYYGAIMKRNGYGTLKLYEDIAEARSIWSYIAQAWMTHFFKFKLIMNIICTYLYQTLYHY